MEHQEREERLLRITRLIRAKGHIKDLRNEPLVPAILDKVQSAYVDSMKLREIVRLLDGMESVKKRETPQEMHQRCIYIYAKNDLIEKIEEAIKFLASQTNLLNTKSSYLSVLEDLDRATMICHKRLTGGTVTLPNEDPKVPECDAAGRSG